MNKHTAWSPIFFCDLFLFILNTDLVSYADDNTSSAMARSKLEVINQSKCAAETLSF